MPKRKQPSPADDVSFYTRLGVFHAVFSMLDLTTDYAIGKFLNITPKQTHLITAGMVYGRKARLLADLIARSDDPEKDKIQAAFGKVRGVHKRDVIAHGYIFADKERVIFVEKNTSGPLKVTQHSFTLEEFGSHVAALQESGRAFAEAVGCTGDVMVKFGQEVFNFDRKSKISPGKPTDSK